MDSQRGGLIWPIGRLPGTSGGTRAWVGVGRRGGWPGLPAWPDIGGGWGRWGLRGSPRYPHIRDAPPRGRLASERNGILNSSPRATCAGRASRRTVGAVLEAVPCAPTQQRPPPHLPTPALPTVPSTGLVPHRHRPARQPSAGPYPPRTQSSTGPCVGGPTCGAPPPTPLVGEKHSKQSRIGDVPTHVSPHGKQRRQGQPRRGSWWHQHGLRVREEPMAADQTPCPSPPRVRSRSPPKEGPLVARRRCPA